MKIIQFMNEDKESDHCTCGETEGQMHTCPYAEDVNDNSEYECDCCPFCEHQCAMDI